MTGGGHDSLGVAVSCELRNVNFGLIAVSVFRLMMSAVHTILKWLLLAICKKGCRGRIDSPCAALLPNRGLGEKQLPRGRKINCPWHRPRRVYVSRQMAIGWRSGFLHHQPAWPSALTATVISALSSASMTGRPSSSAFWHHALLTTIDKYSRGPGTQRISQGWSTGSDHDAVGNQHQCYDKNRQARYNKEHVASRPIIMINRPDSGVCRRSRREQKQEEYAND